jgi:hypothetical protein
MNQETELSVRCQAGNANHHLWNNNGTFWCHLTVHFADYTKKRLRLSLETADLVHARRLRDSLLASLGCRLEPAPMPAHDRRGCGR